MTNDNNPFIDSDDNERTVIKPSPGGGRRRQSTSVQDTHIRQSDPGQPRVDLPANLAEGTGRNGMVVAAFSLLCLANQLRKTIVHKDIEGLRERLVKEIRQFETQALQQGFSPEQVQYGRYALCTFIDETVLNTPWGSGGFWGQKSLLITFHKEAWGGEKFFQFLNHLIRQPAQNSDLLGLFYYCLSLGFQGKYRIDNQGAAKLEQLREELYLVLHRQAGEFEPELSIRWQGIKDRRNVLMRHVPSWVIASLAAVLLLATYLIYLLLINQNSDPVFKDLYAIGQEAPLVAERSVAPVANPNPVESSFQKIRTFLAPEIARRELEVLATSAGRIVRIRGMFGSAQDHVKEKYYPLLQRVAEALTEEPGRILVAGHTDVVPIRTLQFPSNWHLSQGRAKDVERILLESGQLTGRVESEGRADNEPVAANDTEVGRELNRRVDIILK